jgi:hypothetical protein
LSKLDAQHGQLGAQLCSWLPKALQKAASVNVQVIWRLDTGARTYLPRLSGAITSISPVPIDAACYILTQADNTIRLVSNGPLDILHF